MIPGDVFRHQPVLVGDRVHLEPLTQVVLEDYRETVNDREVRRLTGSHGGVDRPRVAEWPATRQQQYDRADWPAIRIADGAFLGDAVLNQRSCDHSTLPRPS